VKKSIALLALIGLVIVGCQEKKGSTSTNPSVTEVSPPPAAAPAPQPYVGPTAQATAPQPVTYDAAPTQTASATPGPVAGGNYTVKKGDTLYSIAKSRYGNGNQYTKIVSANPGLAPDRLKVGQSIVVP
jgi:nucleoid-associated protein YgaU